jgi:hypothetical protein
MISKASAIEVNWCTFKHSSLSQAAVKGFNKGIPHGVPGCHVHLVDQLFTNAPITVGLPPASISWHLLKPPVGLADGYLAQEEC